MKKLDNMMTALIVVASLMVTMVIPFSVSAATPAGVTEIIPYYDFATDPPSDQWKKDPGGTTEPEETKNSITFNPAGYMDLNSKTVTASNPPMIKYGYSFPVGSLLTPAASSEDYTLVFKARVKLNDVVNGGKIQFVLATGSGTGTRKIRFYSLITQTAAGSGLTLRFADTMSGASDVLTGITPETWLDTIVTMDIKSSSDVAENCNLYVNGKLFSNVGIGSFKKADLATIAGLMVAIDKNGASGNGTNPPTVASVDDIGMYIVNKTQSQLAFSIDSVNNGVEYDVPVETSSIPFNFTTEIYKDNIVNFIKVSKNGAPLSVTSNDITMHHDQKGFELSLPQLGYDEQYTISFDGLTNIYGTPISNRTSAAFSTVSQSGPSSFRVGSFNDGIISDIAINNNVSIKFTSPVTADMFDGKITISENGGAASVINSSKISVDNNDNSVIILSNLGLKENSAYTITLSDTIMNGAGIVIKGTLSYNFATAIFRVDSFAPISSEMPLKGGSATIKFSTPVNASSFSGKFALSNDTAGTSSVIDNASVLQIDEFTLKILLPELVEENSYKLTLSNTAVNTNGTAITGGNLTCSFYTAMTGNLNKYIDYTNLKVGSAPPVANGNTYYGSVKAAADGSKTVLDLGPATSNDVYNVVGISKPFTSLANTFVYETQLKLKSGSGQLRIRLQQGKENNNVANDIIFFRSNKFSLRERNYGTHDVNKIIEVGDFRNDVWYTLRVYLDIKSASPKMNVFLISEDNVENYATYDVSIDPTMLAIGGNPWNTMTNIGIYMQYGSSYNLEAFQRYQKVYEYFPAASQPSLENGSTNVAEGYIPYIDFTTPVAGQGSNFTLKINDVITTAKTTLSEDGRRVYIASEGEFLPSSVCTVSAANVKDIAGNAVTVQPFTFTVKPFDLNASNVTTTPIGVGQVNVTGKLQNVSASNKTAVVIVALFEKRDGEIMWVKQTATEIAVAAGASNVPLSASISLSSDEVTGNGKEFLIKTFIWDKNTLLPAIPSPIVIQ